MKLQIPVSLDSACVACFAPQAIISQRESDMQKELLTPFLTSGSEVLSQIVGADVAHGALVERSARFLSCPITVLIGVIGDVKGQVIFGLSHEMARQIASAMMCCEIDTLDEMSFSALSELANMISGNAMALLTDTGMRCDVTTPTLMLGTDVELATQIPAMMAPLQTPFGDVEVNVALVKVE